MHIAKGSEYRGLRVKRGRVVYCALEGMSGFKLRVAAYRETHPGSDDAPMSLMFTPLDLIKNVKDLITSIRAQLPDGERPVAVAIDTLNRSLVGSESKDVDMAAYVRAADAIRDAFDCVVVIIHHCGHNDDRPRGHSSLLGAADILISVKRDAANNIVATVDDVKDGEGRGLVVVSRLLKVEVGKDEDGDTMTSCVIEPVEGLDAAKVEAKSKKGLPNAAKLALRALHAAVGDVGEIPATSHAPSGVKGVTLKQWRDFADRTGVSGSDKPHSRAAAFKRASDALQVAGKIGIWEPYVWPVYESGSG
jgi:AAA domain